MSRICPRALNSHHSTLCALPEGDKFCICWIFWKLSWWESLWDLPVRSMTNTTEVGKYCKQAKVKFSILFLSSSARFSNPGVSVTCTELSNEQLSCPYVLVDIIIGTVRHARMTHTQLSKDETEKMRLQMPNQTVPQPCAWKKATHLVSLPIHIEVAHFDSPGRERVMANLWKAGRQQLHEWRLSNIRGANQCYLHLH